MTERVCPGPWIWYPCTDGAILHCATCRDITVTGDFIDQAHTGTPVLMEGLAL